MISNDPDFNARVREAAEINRKAGDYVAPSPFPSRVMLVRDGEELIEPHSDEDEAGT
jgi:hypothetical protein